MDGNCRTQAVSVALVCLLRSFADYLLGPPDYHKWVLHHYPRITDGWSIVRAFARTMAVKELGRTSLYSKRCLSIHGSQYICSILVDLLGIVTSIFRNVIPSKTLKVTTLLVVSRPSPGWILSWLVRWREPWSFCKTLISYNRSRLYTDFSTRFGRGACTQCIILFHDKCRFLNCHDWSYAGTF